MKSRYPEVVARYIRTYQEVIGALRAYEEGGVGPRAEQYREARRTNVAAIAAALGRHPFDYSAAIRTAQELSRSRSGRSGRDAASSDEAQRRAERDIEEVLLPILKGYANPAAFFREVAPKLDPECFDPQRLSAGALDDDDALVITCVDRWGGGALLNDEARGAFAVASPWVQNICLDAIDDRTRKRRRGRRPLAEWQTQQSLRSQGGIEKLGQDLGLTDGALDKRLQRLKAKSDSVKKAKRQNSD